MPNRVQRATGGIIAGGSAGTLGLTAKRGNDMHTEYKTHHLFVRDEDRQPGWFHVIAPDSIIGRRAGFVCERDNSGIYGLHLILSFTGTTKKMFVFNFGRQEMQDLPHYWLRITWRSPLSWSRFDHRCHFGSFDTAHGVTAESLL